MRRHLLVAVLVLAALYAGYRYTLHRIVEAKLDAIRKQGSPVTLAQLGKWYPQPPLSENAATVYCEAFSRYIGVTNYVARHDKPKLRLFAATSALLFEGRQPSTAELDAIAAYLADNRETLALLHKAATIRQCRYPVHEPPDDHQLAQYFEGVRGGVHLLLLEAIGAAGSGDAFQSCDAIVSTLFLIHSLCAEPLLDDGKFRTDQQRLCVRVLRSVLQHTTPTDAQLAALASAVAMSEDSQALRRAFIAERVTAREVVRQRPLLEPIRGLFEKGPREVVPLAMVELQLLGYRLGAREELDFLTYLNTLHLAIEAANDAWPNRLAVSKLLRAQDGRLSVHPFREFTVEIDASNAALLRTAGAAISVERSRLANAQLPDKFSEPAPVDPFTGQPLRYKKLAEGYVVYSVGEDGKDDGGDEKNDIAFTVER
jgi:hypothetical protein